MGKSKQKNSSTIINPKKSIKHSIAKKKSTSSSGGIDEIDSLFAKKKESNKEIQQQLSKEKEIAKFERQRRKQARLDEEADDYTLRGGSSSSAAASTMGSGGKKKGGDAVAPSSLHAKATKLSSLSYTRSDLDQLNDSQKKECKGKWAKDGLGGVFNGEGYTGRRDDGGHRVFKAHLMNKDTAGETPDCPFDCDCCFI